MQKLADCRQKQKGLHYPRGHEIYNRLSQICYSQSQASKQGSKPKDVDLPAAVRDKLLEVSVIYQDQDDNRRREDQVEAYLQRWDLDNHNKDGKRHFFDTYENAVFWLKSSQLIVAKGSVVLRRS